MNIIVTGAKGQLGKEIIRQTAMNREFNVIPVDIDNLDITDSTKVNTFFLDTKPDAVINCAAFTNVDGCESHEMEAFAANAIGPRNLAASAERMGAKIIQISTDYVFNGNATTPWREYDPVSPESVYGRSKEMGERLVRDTNPRHFILRTAWLYGDGNNFVKTILRLSAEQEQLKIVDDQFGSPTSTVDLAGCILEMVKTDSYGTYHTTCEGSCSWFEFTKKILALSGIQKEVLPITSEDLKRPAKRPKYSVLENFMLKVSNRNRFRSWEEALSEYLHS